MHGYYKNTNPNQGVALIFNHNVLDTGETTIRRKSLLYENKLPKCLLNFGFDVHSFSDLTLEELELKLEEVSGEDHSAANCLLVIFVGFGYNETLWAKDKSYHINTLLAPFLSSDCPSLANKPKIFLILGQQDEKLNIKDNRNRPSFRLSSTLESDFLVTYSVLGSDQNMVYNDPIKKVKQMILTTLKLGNYHHEDRSKTISVCNANTPQEMFMTSLYDSLDFNSDNPDGIDVQELLTYICYCISLDYKNLENILKLKVINKFKRSFVLRRMDCKKEFI